MKAGDVIVQVGSVEVSSIEQLRHALQAQAEHHRVKLEIVRNRKAKEMSVLLTPRFKLVKPISVRAAR